MNGKCSYLLASFEVGRRVTKLHDRKQSYHYWIAMARHSKTSLVSKVEGTWHSKDHGQ